VKHRYGPVAVWLAAIVACVILVTRTEFSADLTAFLPRSASPAQEVLVEQLRDGVVSRLVLIGLEGAPPEVLAQTSKALAGALRKLDAFLAVDNGEDTGHAKDREFLWHNRYLLSPAISKDQFSSAAMRIALEESVQSLGSPAGMLVQRTLPNDPTGELMRLVTALEGQVRPASRHGVWFSADGTRALLVAHTRAAGYDIDGQARALDAIRSAFSAVVQSGDTAVPRLLVTGPGVFSVSSRALIKKDAWRFALIAISLVAALLLALYRSARVLTLGLLPVASGALAGVAAVSLGYGSVHGVTLGFGATLIGEGVDYAIYLFTQTVPGKSPRAVLTRIWPTLRLGLMTSICGFGAMLFSGFPGLAQIGLFSITGLVVALIVTRWVLPALIAEGYAVRSAGAAPRMMWLVQHAPRLRHAAMLVTASAAVFLIAERSSLWSDDLSRLNPVPLSEQRLDGEMRRDIGAPDVRHLVVVNASDRQGALRSAEATAAILEHAVERKALAGFDSPSLYLPSLDTQRARQSAIPAPEVLRANLEEASRGLPFRAHVFEPFLRDASAAKNAAPLERENLEGTRLALKVDSLLVRREGGWAAILPLRGVSDPQAIGSALDRQKGSDIVLLDLKGATDDMFRTYRREALAHAALGAAAILLLLLLALRSPRRVFSVVAPLAAAVTVTFAVLVLCVGSLSIFHLVGLLLVIAVGSNYSLFFERYREAAEDRSRTILSVSFATLSTVLGFGVLSFSSVPVLSALGSTVGLGAILSFAFSAIFISSDTRRVYQ
jgi:predicted exporter